MTFGLFIRCKAIQYIRYNPIQVVIQPVCPKPRLKLITADQHLPPDLVGRQTLDPDIIAQRRHRDAAKLRECLQVKVRWLYV